MGAFLARGHCDRIGSNARDRALRASGYLLLAANAAGFLVVPAVALSSHRWGAIQGTLPIFGVAAALLGTGLPLIAHFGIAPDDRAGIRMSYLYVANIVGSVVGSLTTGFWLLDVLSLQDLCSLLALVGVFASGIVVLALGGTTWLQRVAAGLAVAMVAGGILALAPTLYSRVYEKLLQGDKLAEGKTFAHIVETRSGIVTVSPSGTVYGGGSYDGMFSTDPHPDRDSNRVLRAYLVPLLHETPREVLMVGLGSGSWAQVLAHHPAVDRLTVVEINPPTWRRCGARPSLHPSSRTPSSIS